MLILEGFSSNYKCQDCNRWEKHLHNFWVPSWENQSYLSNIHLWKKHSEHPQIPTSWFPHGCFFFFFPPLFLPCAFQEIITEVDKVLILLRITHKESLLIFFFSFTEITKACIAGFQKLLGMIRHFFSNINFKVFACIKHWFIRESANNALSRKHVITGNPH